MLPLESSKSVAAYILQSVVSRRNFYHAVNREDWPHSSATNDGLCGTTWAISARYMQPLKQTPAADALRID